MESEIRTYQDQLEWSNKQLRAENERLREALNNVIKVDRNDFLLWTEQIRMMKNTAQQALRGV